MLLTSSGARAATIETAVMPGPVIQGHAELEGDCSNCHVRFDRAAQPRLCLDCHKPVRADIAARTGYHGRIPEAGRECRSCHTEHKGRQARIVTLRERQFDHTQTDFPLSGKHKLKPCASCHRPGLRHRQAPVDCVGCHRKDDRHKGGLGTSCASCHDEEGWKHARFDHAKTKFPLRRAHADARIQCESCHADHRYKGTPQDCVSCHREDDMKKGHKGHFGNRCEKCHEESAWKTPTFRHERDTAYPLVDRHRLVKCDSCHRGPLFAERLPTRCIACHRANDVHKTTLGDRCDKCHSPRGWKGNSFDHDRDTAFPLVERHRLVKCDSCHRAPQFGEKPATRCVACHRENDVHKATLGDKCDKCHSARGWKTTSFDHDADTHFPLRDRHKAAACDACHKDKGLREKPPLACASCHERDDRERGHRGNLGDRCETCHDARTFKPSIFEHDRHTSFALEGKHTLVKCASCHRDTLFRTKTQQACYGCHKDQDVHFATYGLECESCHTPQAWRKVKPGAPIPGRKP